jgi:hypothetical protein
MVSYFVNEAGCRSRYGLQNLKIILWYMCLFVDSARKLSAEFFQRMTQYELSLF